MRLFLKVLVGVLAAGCKPPPKADAPKAAAASQAATNAASALALEDEATSPLLEEVAKRLLGLNPKAGDVHDHIGLINVAAAFGYDLPYNTCGQAWRIRVSGEGSALQLMLTASHSQGRGERCAEPNADAPVTYTFRNWVVTSSQISPAPFDEGSKPRHAPLAMGEANGLVVAGPQLTLAGGLAVWRTKEAVESHVAATNGHDEAMQLSYQRQLASDPQVRLVHPSVSSGGDINLVARPDEHGLLTFDFASTLSNEPPPVATMACRAEVAVPAGCIYHGTLTAEFEQVQTRLKAALQVQPMMVGFKGRLATQSPCANRALRVDNGSCNGAMGDDRKGVEVWFGQLHGHPDFIEDLSQQASSTQVGNWDFAAMRLLPTQQNQGIPNLDWALRYLHSGEFSRANVALQEVQEKLSACTLHISVDPASPPSCGRNVPDRAIAPSAF